MRTCDHPSPDRSRQTARIAEYAAKAVRRQDKISPPDAEDFGRCAPVGARRYRPCNRTSAALNVLRSTQGIVIGPKPPGTGGKDATESISVAAAPLLNACAPS